MGKGEKEVVAEGSHNLQKNFKETVEIEAYFSKISGSWQFSKTEKFHDISRKFLAIFSKFQIIIGKNASKS